MKPADAKRLDAHELRRIAVIAECDPRTVRRYIGGSPVSPLVKQRIERALRQLGGGAK